MTEFLRMSGIYWGLTAMDLMGQLHRMNKPEVLQFVKSCQHTNGGLGPTIHQDPHLLYTLSAIQVRRTEEERALRAVSLVLPSSDPHPV